MTQISDFSSFFEVGVGLGIALSLFRIPIDNRKSALVNRVDNELRLFSHQQTPLAQARYERAGEIAINLEAAILRVEKDGRYLPIVALMGALMNVTLMFLAAIYPENPASVGHIWFFGFVAFGWYVFLSFLIIFSVEKLFGPIEADLDRLPHNCI